MTRSKKTGARECPQDEGLTIAAEFFHDLQEKAPANLLRLARELQDELDAREGRPGRKRFH